MSAHNMQSCLTKGLLRAVASAHNRQIAEHSIQQAGQALTLSFPTMSEKQLPQAMAQTLQASMQFWAF